jgi:acetyl-CoA carboxylase biotin carboxyl carrier protein
MDHEHTKSGVNGMGGPSGSQDVFDVRKIRRLIELMNEHDLQEMDLRQGDTRIQLRRAAETFIAASPAAIPAAAPAPAPVAAPAPPAPSAASVDDPNVAIIKSPMVGTFYSASDPDSPPYVKVGDPIGKETTVCIVEAMKVFNEIQAELAGTITAVLVENGEPVEFGQPLFKVKTG